jgi:DNA-binding transcriptional regulator YiaG
MRAPPSSTFTQATATGIPAGFEATTRDRARALRRCRYFSVLKRDLLYIQATPRGVTMNGQRYAIWRQQREEDLRVRRAAIQPPIATSLPETLDVAAIRMALPGRPHAVTQDQFARRFGFSLGAVRDWEQGRRKPDGAARALLFLIAHDAAGIEAAIQAAIIGKLVEPIPQNADGSNLQ